MHNALELVGALTSLLAAMAAQAPHRASNSGQVALVREAPNRLTALYPYGRDRVCGKTVVVALP